MKRPPQIIPAVGDEWELKRPGKRRIVKTVGRLARIRPSFKDNRGRQREWCWWVSWKRLPKGRYSGISLRTLLLHGRRLSTKPERDAAIDARIAARK